MLGPMPSRLGEWYWNELPQHAGPWHLGPADNDDDEPNLATFREFTHRTNKETACQQDVCGGSERSAKAAPDRAPPKERCLSIL